LGWTLWLQGGGQKRLGNSSDDASEVHLGSGHGRQRAVELVADALAALPEESVLAVIHRAGAEKTFLEHPPPREQWPDPPVDGG